jgi:hypothetical protein
MKPSLKKKINCLLVLMGCATFTALAQQPYKYKTAVQRVDSSGFYKILLQPNLTGKCQPGLADIRLVDDQRKPVPYLLGNALPVQVKTSYRELPRMATAAVKDSLTTYIAQNPQRLSIDQLWIKLRNTAVNRTVNVLGSDDLQHWFAIKENILLQEAADQKDGTFEELITLPSSTYRFLKIEVNGKNRAPINIIKAGIYMNLASKPEYAALPKATLFSATKGSTSLITISFKEPYRVDRLHLQITGTKYYRRPLRVYSISGNKKEWLKEALITSAGDGDIEVSAQTSKLLLEVDNEDNPQLVVQSVEAYQLKQSLVAYLNKGHQYQLSFGNANVNAPRYDLQFFTDSIKSGLLPVISHTDIIPVAQAKPVQQPSGVIPVCLIWVAGGLALVVLLVLTLKMTKEVGKSHTRE